MNDARIRWQCRRGMRELDLMLAAWLDRAYPQAGDGQKKAFRELLALPDPELMAYLLGGQTPEDNAIAAIVAEIRDHSQA